MKTYQRKRKTSISELPNEIIHQIFSSFTTKSAAQTSVLSKRLHQAWTSSLFLHFDQKEYASVPDSINSVDRAIQLCGDRDTKLERFMLSWREGFDMPKAVPWLQYAMRYGVREICLDIPPGKEGRKLPSFLFHGVVKVCYYSSSL